MSNSSQFLFIFFALLLGASAGAQSSEKDRLSGFAEHYEDQERFGRAREQGEKAYFEEEEQWENQKSRALKDYKATKKSESMSDEGPEAKADATAKKEYLDSYEKERRTYAKERAKQDVVVRENANLPSEAQELGLDRERPRYDYSKRALYGAQPKYGKGAPGSGGTFGGESPRAISPGGTSFPPPPTFDDFSDNDGGYVPAPNIPEDYGDVPPPPPPPPIPMGDDFGGESDFPSPPPPPPPPFNEDGDGF